MSDGSSLINILLCLISLILSVIAYLLKDLKENFEKRIDSIDTRVEEVKEKYVTKELCSYHRLYFVKHHEERE